MIYEIEREVLIEILREMNRQGITPEEIHRYLYPSITAASIRNYIEGRSKPKKTKFNLILKGLREHFGINYNAVLAKMLMDNNVNSIKELIIQELSKTKIGDSF